MTCPECGGGERRQIAPGYWECQSMVLTPGMVPLPNGLLTPGPVDGTCGHCYHEGLPRSDAANAQCVCGTFAIGKCVRCGKGVCGHHSNFHSGSRLCIACIRAVRSEEDAMRNREIAEAIEVGRRAVGRFIDVASKAGNPGAKPLWLEPRSKATDNNDEEYPRRFARRLRKWCPPSGWKRKRWLNTASEWKSDYMRKRTPVGYGWEVRIEHPSGANHYTTFHGDDTVTSYPYYPVLLTTGEIRACRTDSNFWWGFPLLCRPDSTTGSNHICEHLSSRIETGDIYWLNLEEHVLHVLAKKLGMNLE
jgi:hypothetical protein